jgi:cytidylate kinase
MTRPLIIAIDGPSGAGKSTLGRMLARQLGLLYIDTGSMYRAVALIYGLNILEEEKRRVFEGTALSSLNNP